MRPLCTALLTLCPTLLYFAVQSGDLLSAAGWAGAAIVAAWGRERSEKRC